MAALTQGRAGRTEVDALIAMANVCEALYRMGFGNEYKDVIKQGFDALLAVGRRGAKANRFVLKAEEMTALNVLMELHDAQMEVITVKDMERAFKIVDEEHRLRRMQPVVEKNE